MTSVSVGFVPLQLWHWRHRIRAIRTAPRPSSIFLQIMSWIVSSVSFSGLCNRKWETLCNLAVCSACKRCISEGPSTPIHGRLPDASTRRRVFQPPPFPELGCIPRSRRRLLVLLHDPWALAPTFLVQHETNSDASIPPLRCAGEGNGSIQSSRSSVSRRL